MNRNDLIIPVIAALNTGLSERSITANVKASYSPLNVGVASGPNIYLHLILNSRSSLQGSSSVYNSDDDDYDTEKRTYYDSTFQISAESIEDPSDLSFVSASDLVAYSSDILEDPEIQKTLSSSGIHLHTITDIRVNYFTNDKNNHQENPSFDFSLRYLRSRQTKTEKVTGQTATLNSV